MIIKLNYLTYLIKTKLVIALRSPYDLNKLEDCSNYVCCYEATLPALLISKVLKVNYAVGKLPVKLR